jgi:hypothetical protein
VREGEEDHGWDFFGGGAPPVSLPDP